MTEIAVVIVSWNCKDKLEECLTSLQKCKSTLTLKVYVVDNASSDGTEKMVLDKFQDINFIQSGANLGFAKANNIGLTHCNTEFVLFLNPDTIVNTLAIAAMVEKMNDDTDIGIVSCKTIKKNGSVNDVGLQWFPNPWNKMSELMFYSEQTKNKIPWLFPIHDPEKSGFVEFVPGCCMFMRRKDLDRIGSFDERFFMYGEDADLCRRVRNTDKKIFYLAENTIIHECGGASRNVVQKKQLNLYYSSIYNLVKKHNGNLQGKLFRMVVIGGGLYRMGLSLLFLKGEQRSYCLEKFCYLIGWAIGLKER